MGTLPTSIRILVQFEWVLCLNHAWGISDFFVQKQKADPLVKFSSSSAAGVNQGTCSLPSAPQVVGCLGYCGHTLWQQLQYKNPSFVVLWGQALEVLAVTSRTRLQQFCFVLIGISVFILEQSHQVVLFIKTGQFGLCVAWEVKPCCCPWTGGNSSRCSDSRLTYACILQGQGCSRSLLVLFCSQCSFL